MYLAKKQNLFVTIFDVTTSFQFTGLENYANVSIDGTPLLEHKVKLCIMKNGSPSVNEKLLVEEIHDASYIMKHG